MPRRRPAAPRRTTAVRLAVQLAILAILVLVAAACGPAQQDPSGAPGSEATAPSGPATSVEPAASPAASATFVVPATGFAFDAESVLAYYRGVGYACRAPDADPRLAGAIATSCDLVDADGRTWTIGLVTGPDGTIVDGFASVLGATDEAIVDPVVALEPLAGFLGAMLGEARGTELVTWLAGHLGDVRAATTTGGLVVETYTSDAAGRTALVVEVRTPAFGDGELVPGSSSVPESAAPPG